MRIRIMLTTTHVCVCILILLLNLIGRAVFISYSKSFESTSWSFDRRPCNLPKLAAQNSHIKRCLNVKTYKQMTEMVMLSILYRWFYRCFNPWFEKSVSCYKQGDRFWAPEKKKHYPILHTQTHTEMQILKKQNWPIWLLVWFYLYTYTLTHTKHTCI